MRIIGLSIVGGVGFIIDGGILIWLVNINLNIYMARLLSFCMATLVTWKLNRRFVFPDRGAKESSKSKEYAKYFSVQIVGAIANLFVFMTLVSLFSSLRLVPLIPLAIGAFFGLLVNFSGAHFWVFPSQKRD